MAAHVHWFVYSPAGYGPTSTGICKRCGKKVEHSNVYDADRPGYEGAAMRQALPGTRGNGVVKKRPPTLGRKPETSWVAPLANERMTR